MKKSVRILLFIAVPIIGFTIYAVQSISPQKNDTAASEYIKTLIPQIFEHWDAEAFLKHAADDYSVTVYEPISQKEADQEKPEQFKNHKHAADVTGNADLVRQLFITESKQMGVFHHYGPFYCFDIFGSAECFPKFLVEFEKMNAIIVVVLKPAKDGAYVISQLNILPIEIDITQLQDSANKGDVSAQIDLGTAYLKGTIVAKDEAQAAKWFTRAAEQGNSQAEVLLSVMYAQGVGVPKDNTEEIKWLQKSAEQGNKIAENNLGDAYENGRGGLAKDTVHAYMWYDLSAAQGADIAIKGRDSVAKIMTPDQINEAKELAEQWRQKHQQK